MCGVFAQNACARCLKMRVLVKRGPRRWLLYWKPLKGRNWYPINSENVAFAGALEQIRAKINALLQGKTGQAEFEAYYCRATKTLALWA
jgi:hypothetical protein